jgi:hypothetical protein
MEKIRGKSLLEWKEYCSSENVPVKTMKYIICLEERIKQLTLTDVVVSNCLGVKVNKSKAKHKIEIRDTVFKKGSSLNNN